MKKASILGLLLFSAAMLIAENAKPAIDRISVLATQVVIHVTVPAGLASVTLESRPQFGRGSWTPIGVTRTDGTAQEVSFTGPRSPEMLMFRVRATSQEILPAAFFRGTNTFAGPISNEASVQFLANNSPPRDVTNAPAEGDATRNVIESDIYKIANGRVYYFNHNRGLQVIDISDPTHSALAGTFRYPGAGEQLYLAASNHVALLGRNGCGWGQTGPASELVILNVSGDSPTLVNRLPFNGYIQESRMVGHILYIATYSYCATTNASTGSTYWESGVEIYSFDLSNPAQSRQVDVIWLPGYATAVMATDRFLFAAVQDPNNYNASLLQIIGISDAGGRMHRILEKRVAGRVNDKFKLHWNDNVLSVISETFSTQSNRTLRASLLETFRFPDPLAFPPISRLGSVEVGHGEQLFATRFDGDKAYIVTFLVIDPLWIVDLSDPRNPRVTGELEVPGFSTYIHPLGDKLVSIGYETSNSWRVAVSLFDVGDPANPSLLSRVPLGEHSSWSEAAYDEKAFTVLEYAGLILVPYTGYNSNSNTRAVQIIDLNTNSLSARGRIDHEITPRRAFLANDQVLSLAATEMLSVNISDRDRPIVNSELELSWSVDHLFLKNQHLIQIPQEQNVWFYTDSSPKQTTIRISSSTQPDSIVGKYLFTNSLPVAAADLRGDYLYIAQATQSFPWYWWLPSPLPAQENILELTILDVSSLPQIGFVGRTTVKLNSGIDSLGVVWPNDSTLVLSGGFQSFYRYPMLMTDALTVAPWHAGNSGGWQFAFDVSNPLQPTLASTNYIQSTNTYAWSYSSAHAADNLVFQTYETTEYREDIQRPPYVYREYDGTNSVLKTNIPPPGAWVQVTFLQVIDYTDPSTPVYRPLLRVPGNLLGLSHGGSLIYTTGYRYNPTNYTSDYTEWVNALAYDGVNVSLVDSLQVGNRWPRATFLHGTNVFLARPETDRFTLEKWHLSFATGSFEQTYSTELMQAVQELFADGNFLLAQAHDSIHAFAGTLESGPLRRLGEYRVPGCVYPQSSRARMNEIGAWLPLSQFGVAFFPFSAPQP